MPTNTVTTERPVENLDAEIDRLIPGDAFSEEFIRQGIAAHAASTVLSPSDFDRLVIGRGWIR